MLLIYVILGIAIIGGVIYFLMKSGKIADKDGNNIPDVVDEKIAQAKEVAEEVKFRVERVAEEAKDIANAVKEVAKQSKDVITAAKGENRKGRKINN